MKFLAILIAVVAFSSISARAAVLAQYPFDSSLRTSTDTNVATVAGAFNDGAGWTSTIDTTRGNPTPAVSVDSTQTDGTNEAGAVSANDYYSFNLTPLPNVEMTLTGFTFDYANYSTDGTFQAEGFFVRCSLDGYMTDLATGVLATAASAGTFHTSAFALSDPMFQNLSSTVQFRIYIADSANINTRGALVDNVAVTGTITIVPEPSTFLLVSLSGVGLLLAKVRRNRRLQLIPNE